MKLFSTHEASDVGLILIFFLNIRLLKKGESMVIDPGKLYAYV